jgi:hypothetical protein
MNQAHSASATFTLNSYRINVVKSGNGWGIVSSNLGNIDCGLDIYRPAMPPYHTVCAATLSYGTAIRLTAAASQQSEMYVGAWGGCNSSAGAICDVTITADRTVTANFYGDGVDVRYVQQPDWHGSLGTGHVTSMPAGVNCGDVIAHNNHCRWRFHWSSQIVLQYTATGGSSFVGWQGCDRLQPSAVRGQLDCVVDAYGVKQVTATFEGNTII